MGKNWLHLLQNLYDSKYVAVEYSFSDFSLNLHLSPGASQGRSYKWYWHNIVLLVLLTLPLVKQESPAVADKPARRLRKVCMVYIRAVGL